MPEEQGNSQGETGKVAVAEKPAEVKKETGTNQGVPTTATPEKHPVETKPGEPVITSENYRNLQRNLAARDRELGAIRKQNSLLLDAEIARRRDTGATPEDDPVLKDAEAVKAELAESDKQGKVEEEMRTEADETWKHINQTLKDLGWKSDDEKLAPARELYTKGDFLAAEHEMTKIIIADHKALLADVNKEVERRLEIERRGNLPKVDKTGPTAPNSNWANLSPDQKITEGLRQKRQQKEK